MDCWDKLVCWSKTHWAVADISLGWILASDKKDQLRKVWALIHNAAWKAFLLHPKWCNLMSWREVKCTVSANRSSKMSSEELWEFGVRTFWCDAGLRNADMISVNLHWLPYVWGRWRGLYICAFAHGSANLKIPMQPLALECVCKFMAFLKGFGFYKFKILAGWEKYNPASMCFLVIKKKISIFSLHSHMKIQATKASLFHLKNSNSFDTLTSGFWDEQF